MAANIFLDIFCEEASGFAGGSVEARFARAARIRCLLGLRPLLGLRALLGLRPYPRAKRARPKAVRWAAAGAGGGPEPRRAAIFGGTIF